jgi:DNA repair protein RadD
MNQHGLFDFVREPPRPRGYQTRALDEVARTLEAGARAVLLVAPTGSGKTVIAAEIVRRNAGKKMLFLAPRRELIHQTCRKLDDVGVQYGVILAGDNRTNQYAHVQVASVDTLISRVMRRKKMAPLPFDLIVIDEAHVGLTDTRARLLALWPDARIIGLTATPCRSDGKAMGRVYDEMVEVSTVTELVGLGYLVPARYFAPSTPNLKGVRTTAGDYNQLDLDGVMNRPTLTGDIVSHWMEHANDRRTVVFATSIAHSAALAEEFRSHGVSAEHVDANTPQMLREAMFRRFTNGETQVLTNCTLASIGFDLPDLNCVVFARPTKSLGLYIQMLGRGLRPAPGKLDCLVLDHAGNVHRHGFATDERFWTLHGKYAEDLEKKERAKQKKEKDGDTAITCRQCKCVYEGGAQCPVCGWSPPPKIRPVSTMDGSLVEIDGKGRVPASQMTKEQRMHFYFELSGYGQMKGYKPGWAANQYRERFGEWPPWSWKTHVEKHGGIEPGLGTMRFIQSRMIAYHKARGSNPFSRAPVDA